MRPDAEEILRLVLTRLDDMKAEDILTIDLRDKSSIGDYMVVSSGRWSRICTKSALRHMSKACRIVTGC
jgi:ribosomal silencing factor RsfS